MREIQLTALLALGALAACLPGQAEEPVEVGKVRSEANARGCYPQALSSEHAICLCEDFADVGTLRVLRGEPDREASIGVNGDTDVVAAIHVEGSWHAYNGFDAVIDADVEGDIVTTRGFSWVGQQHVGGDLSVGGNVSGVGVLVVDGTLRVAGHVTIVGDKDVGATGAYQAPAGPPCDCSGESFFDVARAVEDARIHNDNGDIGLAADGGSVVIGAEELSLPSGRFFIDGLTTIGAMRLHVEGHAALFVAGSIEVIGAELITVAPGASLDLYVAGSITTVGAVEVGDATDPSAFRLYLGGSDPVLVSVGAQRFNGYIYAPRAEIDYVGATEIHGGLFARRLVGVGELTVRYAGPAEIDDETCTAEDLGKEIVDDEPGDVY